MGKTVSVFKQQWDPKGSLHVPSFSPRHVDEAHGPHVAATDPTCT